MNLLEYIKKFPTFYVGKKSQKQEPVLAAFYGVDEVMCLNLSLQNNLSILNQNLVLQMKSTAGNGKFTKLFILVFSGSRYNLFKHNCNNFSNEVSQFLVGVSIPSYILELPDVIQNT